MNSKMIELSRDLDASYNDAVKDLRDRKNSSASKDMFSNMVYYTGTGAGIGSFLGPIGTTIGASLGFVFSIIHQLVNVFSGKYDTEREEKVLKNIYDDQSTQVSNEHKEFQLRKASLGLNKETQLNELKSKREKTRNTFTSQISSLRFQNESLSERVSNIRETLSLVSKKSAAQLKFIRGNYYNGMAKLQNSQNEISSYMKSALSLKLASDRMSDRQAQTGVSILVSGFQANVGDDSEDVILNATKHIIESSEALSKQMDNIEQVKNQVQSRYEQNLITGVSKLKDNYLRSSDALNKFSLSIRNENLSLQTSIEGLNLNRTLYTLDLYKNNSAIQQIYNRSAIFNSEFDSLRNYINRDYLNKLSSGEFNRDRDINSILRSTQSSLLNSSVNEINRSNDDTDRAVSKVFSGITGGVEGIYSNNQNWNKEKNREEKMKLLKDIKNKLRDIGGSTSDDYR